jgi:carboxyl-terminal processing protease
MRRGALVWLLLALPSLAWAQPAAVESMPPTLAQRVFDEVVDAVERHYYDPTLKGLDWRALSSRYRGRLADKATSSAVHAHINSLLAQLNDSHTRLVPLATAQSQSAQAVTANARGVRLGEHDGVIFVRDCLPGSAAALAGIREGDVIERVGAEPAPQRYARALEALSAVEVVSRRREAALARVLPSTSTEVWELAIRRDAGRVVVRVQDAQAVSLGAASVDALTIDVARLSIRRFRADVLETSAAFFDNQGSRGFVLDLRGNDGGDLAVATLVAERLFDRPVTMAIERSRDEGASLARERRWNIGGKPKARDEPLAVLIDERCASACEIFAAAMKENERARVFGHASAGIVAGISTKPITLADGSGLNVSRLGLWSPRRARLDNVGVAPHESCVVTPEQRARGEDCVLRSAVKWLSGQIAY